MKRLLLLTILTAVFFHSKSQNLSYTCPRDTAIGCGATCLTLKNRFPDLRSLSTDYSITNISGIAGCRPYVDPGTPGPATSISADDVYSQVINMSFNFIFYGISYNSLIVSPNGLVSFNIANAGLGTTYATAAGDLPNTYYDKAIIMGP